MVWSLTDAASDAVHESVPFPSPGEPVEQFLVDYAERQLRVVLSPRLMGLRRLVIAELVRFPELAEVLYQRGPERAITALAGLFQNLTSSGLLNVTDFRTAATHFNWLVMGEAVNRAMLLGDAALPTTAEQGRLARESVRVFMAAYGVGEAVRSGTFTP